MGTAQLQGELWSAHARSWATLQERTLLPAFEVVLTKVNAGPGLSLLDIGCGSGMAPMLAALRGSGGNGLDARPASIEISRDLAPGGALAIGEIEEVTSPPGASDVLPAFNGF